MSSKKFLIRFFCVFLALMLVIACINVIIDPFFNYRIPKNTANYPNNQSYAYIWKVGRSRQLDGYDAIWVGSSLSSQIKTEYVSQQLDVNCCTGLISSGRPNIYRLFVENAIANNDIQTVYFEFNYSHNTNKNILTEYNMDRIPEYITTETIWDDSEYLWGKIATLHSFETILNTLDNPSALLESMQTEVITENNIMPEDAVFSIEEMAPTLSSNWTKYKETLFPGYTERGLTTIENDIVPLLEQYPDITFVFVVPPTSAFPIARWRDSGMLEEYLESTKTLYLKLLSYNNAELHVINADMEYCMDFDNYMDSSHFEPYGGQLMVDCIKSRAYQVTPENIDDAINWYRQIADVFQWPFLKIDYRGDEVVALQEQLKALNYALEDEEGIFGEYTEAAIMDLQAKYGLEVTGIAFEETRTLIDQLVSDIQ